MKARNLPLERESLPFHLLGAESEEREQALAEFLVERAELWRQYGEYLAAFHKAAFERVALMAKRKNQVLERINIALLVDFLGIPEMISQVGLKRVIEGRRSARDRRNGAGKGH